MDSTRVTIRERHFSAKERTPFLKLGWGRKVIAGIVVGGLTLLGLKMFGQPGAVSDEVIVAGATVLGVFGVVAGEYVWHFMRARGNVLASRLSASNQSLHKFTSQVDELTTQTSEQWRAERKAFDLEYKEYQNELSQFLMTIKNLFIQEGQRQVVTTWHEYLPHPSTVDTALYMFASDLWDHGWSFLGSESNLEALKRRFRTIYGFFDHVYDLLQDFPEDAPQYVNERIKSSQYDPLHVVWYFGHAFADVVYGDEKRRQWIPLPQWVRLWNIWNPGVIIPTNPRQAIEAHDSGGEGAIP